MVVQAGRQGGRLAAADAAGQARLGQAGPLKRSSSSSGSASPLDIFDVYFPCSFWPFLQCLDLEPLYTMIPDASIWIADLALPFEAYSNMPTGFDAP